MEPKYCKDCKYFVAWTNPERLDLSDCSHPESFKFPGGYLVTGAKAVKRMCRSMREFGPCGEKAELFEQQPNDTTTTRDQQHEY